MEGTPRAKRKTGEEAVHAGFALLLTERRAVVFPRGERPSRLTVLQRFQCWTIDLTSYGQLVEGLKPANRFRRLWAD